MLKQKPSYQFRLGRLVQLGESTQNQKQNNFVAVLVPPRLHDLVGLKGVGDSGFKIVFSFFLDL